MSPSGLARPVPAGDAEALPVLRGARLVLASAALPGGAAHAVGRRALLQGAHVTLVAPPAQFGRCREVLEGLPRGAHAVCADLGREEDVAALHEHLRCAYRTVDGVLYEPATGVGDGTTAARELAALARAVAPLLPPRGGSVVALAPQDRGPERAAVEAAAQELARELVPAGGRANVVAAGPQDGARAAGAICFLLAPGSRDCTGRVVHVDGDGRAPAVP